MNSAERPLLLVQQLRVAYPGSAAAIIDGASLSLDRGEIDPVVELDCLLPMIMAIGQGLAITDLPGAGVPYDRIEIMLRATTEAMLRPRRHQA